MRLVHVAEGAQARMEQLLGLANTERPGGLMALAWAATPSLRARFPRLQDALSARYPVTTANLPAGNLPMALSREGLSLPRWPTSVPRDLPCPEGLRLAGHAQAASDLSRVAQSWVDSSLRRRGRRGRVLSREAASAWGDPACAQSFGMALADVALLVPGASLPGLPERFHFAFHGVDPRPLAYRHPHRLTEAAAALHYAVAAGLAMDGVPEAEVPGAAAAAALDLSHGIRGQAAESSALLGALLLGRVERQGGAYLSALLGTAGIADAAGVRRLGARHGAQARLEGTVPSLDLAHAPAVAADGPGILGIPAIPAPAW